MFPWDAFCGVRVSKTCPSCQAEAPLSATRCKSCFHDFSARRWSFGPAAVFGAMAFMMFLAALLFTVIGTFPVDERVLVSAETNSIVIITKYRSGDTTDRIPFSDVIKLEHGLNNNNYEITAVTLSGERRVIATGSDSLMPKADGFALMMGGKPVERLDEVIVAPEAGQAGAH